MANFYLFIASDLTVHELAKELGTILRIQFQPIKDKSELTADPKFWAYECIDKAKNRWFILHKSGHSYINDRDLRFEDYQHYMRVGITSPYQVGLGERDSLIRQVLLDTFEKLKGSGKYNLLATEDLQHKVAQFDRTLE